jgi:cell wall-associated NlpC family hydrolase
MKSVMTLTKKKSPAALTLVAVLAALSFASVATMPTSASAAAKAHLIGNKAVAPPSAPPAVKAMIKAANHIRHEKYHWGGGHAQWNDPKGYDCSGSVSYVLHKAGLLDYPMVSGDFAKWGKKGPSRWVNIWANEDHVFMYIAGLRWDTSYITDGDKSGPGWSELKRPCKGFKLRHPTGVNN